MATIKQIKDIMGEKEESYKFYCNECNEGYPNVIFCLYGHKLRLKNLEDEFVLKKLFEVFKDLNPNALGIDEFEDAIREASERIKNLIKRPKSHEAMSVEIILLRIDDIMGKFALVEQGDKDGN